MKSEFDLKTKLTKYRLDFAKKLDRVWRDREGVTAVEFAMILPFMLVLFIAAVEITGILNHDRKISRISNSVTDLVAQAQDISTTEIGNLFDIGEKILAPYPSTGLNIVVASVSFDNNGVASVDWFDCKLSCSDWSKGGKPPITLPATVAKPNTSIVVGQSNMTYTPPFSGIFTEYFKRAASHELSDTYYLRPRLTDTVTCDDC
jgi:Flp pilus assembly protein TadG